MADKGIVIMTTCPTSKEADSIAKALVNGRLAACVQMFSITSRFVWKGRPMKGKEQMIIIKTRSSLYKKVESKIKQIHGYDLPEIVAIDMASVSNEYMDWILKMTK